MAGWIAVTLSDRQMAHLKAALTAGELYAQPWREALKSVVDMVEARAKKRAPSGENNSIAPAITSSMDARPIPMYGKVTMPRLIHGSFHRTVKGVRKATAEDFNYPAALDASKRYHYRGTSKPTRGWFRGALPRKAVERLLQSVAAQIEARWRQS
jgi:hypothetical protein